MPHDAVTIYDLSFMLPATGPDRQTLEMLARTAGDALVEIKVGEHPVYRRDGDDIRMDLKISLAEAVEGGKVPVSTPSGMVTMSVPSGASSGDLLKLRGKGVQTRPTPGDLLVRLMIVLPRKEDPELREFIRNWSGRKTDVQR